MKDPQFFRGFQILCGSRSATPLLTSPLVMHFRTRSSRTGSCQKTHELENDYDEPFPA